MKKKFKILYSLTILFLLAAIITYATGLSDYAFIPDIAFWISLIILYVTGMRERRKRPT